MTPKKISVWHWDGVYVWRLLYTHWLWSRQWTFFYSSVSNFASEDCNITQMSAYKKYMRGIDINYIEKVINCMEGVQKAFALLLFLFSVLCSIDVWISIVEGGLKHKVLVDSFQICRWVLFSRIWMNFRLFFVFDPLNREPENLWTFSAKVRK